MSINEQEPQDENLAYEQPEPGILPDSESGFTEGELHIRYDEEAKDTGVDEERLAEEFSEL